MSPAQAVHAFIGMGSNLGDGKALIQGAWQALGRVGGIVPDVLSSPYLTAPVGMESAHWFTNAVGRLRVSLPPLDLLRVLLTVEAAFGRTRDEQLPGYQDRSLDLDLLYYGDLVMDCPELILPHPRLADRLFVLVPLAELDPQFRDPGCGRTILDLELRLRARVTGQPPAASTGQEIVRDTWNE